MAKSRRFQAVKQGGPTEIVEVDIPSIEHESEVLVKLHAIATQPLDSKMIDVGLRVAEWPCVPGMNGAGVVSDVGQAVTKFKVGDAVLAHFMPGSKRSGAYQEYAIVKELDCALKPSDLSFEEASSLPIPYITALGAVYSALSVPVPHMPAPTEPYRPKDVLVLGGSSSVGAAAIQLLRLSLPAGANILTTCSARHDARVASLGADRTFDRAAPLADMRAATSSGEGVDAILGAVEGAVDRPEILELLRPRGDRKFAEVISGRDTKSVPEGVTLIPCGGMSVWGKEGTMETLGRLLAEKKFELPVEVRVIGSGLETCDRAIQLMRDGVSGYKAVVSL